MKSKKVNKRNVSEPISILDKITEFLILQTDKTQNIQTIIKEFITKFGEYDKTKELPQLKEGYLELLCYLYNYIMFKKEAKKVGHLNIRYKPISFEEVKSIYASIIYDLKVNKAEINKITMYVDHKKENYNSSTEAKLDELIQEIYSVHGKENGNKILMKLYRYYYAQNNTIVVRVLSKYINTQYGLQYVPTIDRELVYYITKINDILTKYRRIALK